MHSWNLLANVPFIDVVTLTFTQKSTKLFPYYASEIAAHFSWRKVAHKIRKFEELSDRVTEQKSRQIHAISTGVPNKFSIHPLYHNISLTHTM